MMPRLRRGKTNRSGGAGRRRGVGKRNARPALAFRRRRFRISPCEIRRLKLNPKLAQ